MDGKKIYRILELYSRLMNGMLVSKTEEALRYGVNERTIQRDLDDIRNYLESTVETTGVVNSAFIEDEEIRKDFDVLNDSFPTIYRIDRIKHLKVLEERFKIPYKSRFEEGEFRKRIQFMYGGKIQKIKFQYSGSDVDAVLDRLPTAKILVEEDGVYTLTAEVFGKGIEMWMRSQGDCVKVLEYN